MKAPISAAALAIAASLIACGKGKETPIQQMPQAHESAIQGKVSCTDRDQCPENVALLVSAMSDASISSCTAFLIGSELLMTAAACIPQDIQSAGSVCSGRIWTHFAETASIAGESVGCDHIVSIDSRTATLKLSGAVSRQPLEVSHDGLPHREAVKVAKVNPVRTAPPEGELQVVQCRVAQNSLLGADILDECVAVAGNAGAPVLDSDGKVRAVIDRAANESDRTALTQVLNQQKLALLQGRLNPIALTHSLAEPAAPARTPIVRTVLEPRIMQDLRLKVRDWSSSRPQLQWQPKLISSGEALNRLNTRFGESERSVAYGMAIAKCWSRPETWLDEYRRVVRYRSEGLIELNVPIWPIRLGVNAAAQPEFVFSRRTRTLEARLEFNPRSIKDTGKSAAKLTIKDSATGEIVVQNEEIGTCQ